MEDHLRYIKALLLPLVHIIYRKRSVEQSNFHSVMKQLRQLHQQSAICFYALQVTGSLSSIDLACLIETASNGPVRLLLVNYPQLKNALQIINKLGNVEWPSALHSSSQVKVHAYDESTIIGQLVLNTTNHYRNEPDKLALTHELPKIEELVSRQLQWKVSERNWRHRALPDDNISQDLYALLICDDAAYIRKYYETNEDSDQFNIINCYELVVSANGADFFTTDEEDASHQKQRTNIKCNIFINAHLISQPQREFISSKCATMRIKYCFVMPLFDPTLQRIKAKLPNSNRDITLKVCHFY